MPQITGVFRDNWFTEALGSTLLWAVFRPWTKLSKNLHQNFAVKISTASLLFVASVSWCSAASVATWTFANGSSSPAFGAGSASLVGGTTGEIGAGSSGGGSDLGWVTRSYPAAGTGSGTAGVQFSTDIGDALEVSIAYDIKHGATSANRELIYLSFNGSEFQLVAAYSFAPLADPNQWFSRSLTVSLPFSEEPDNTVAVRVLAGFDGAGYVASGAGSDYAPSGEWIFDNFGFSAELTTVPEPASVSLLGLGALVLARRTRARR
jgi:PEP-CTERM motif